MRWVIDFRCMGGNIVEVILSFVGEIGSICFIVFESNYILVSLLFDIYMFIECSYCIVMPSELVFPVLSFLYIACAIIKPLRT